MMMQNHAIDLHMHSVHSDGTFETRDLINMLWDKRVDYFSFTDHDSVGCYFDLREKKAQLYPGVSLIPGVELSCRVNGALRDMLGYGISIDAMDQFLKERYSLENRIRKQQQVLDRFKEICRKKGLIFDEQIQASEGKKAEGYTVMYMELNRHPENLDRYPFVADCTRLFWDHFSNPESEFFVDETFDLPSFEEASEAIHAAGGLAFLAHPLVYAMTDEDTEGLILHALDAGIDGMEVKHQSNKPGHVEKLSAFAKKYRLFTSGGTDFHGYNKPDIKLVEAFGNVKVDYEEVAPWIQSIKPFSCE